MTHSDDWIQIRSLVDRYSLAVNDADEAALAAVFVEDGEWTVDAPFNVHVVGGKAIAASICQTLKGMEFVVQMVHSVVAEVHGNEGKVRSVMHEVARTSDRSGGLFMLGEYEDKVVRTKDGWAFKHRRFKPTYLDETVPSGVTFGKK